MKQTGLLYVLRKADVPKSLLAQEAFGINDLPSLLGGFIAREESCQAVAPWRAVCHPLVILIDEGSLRE